MASPDPNMRHAFHAGPNGRCSYGHCGRAQGADIHEGKVALLAHRSEDSVDPPPVDPPAPPRRAVPWAQLPVVTKVVLGAGAFGVAAVIVCACIAVCAVMLRASGVIG